MWTGPSCGTLLLANGAGNASVARGPKTNVAVDMGQMKLGLSLACAKKLEQIHKPLST